MQDAESGLVLKVANLSKAAGDADSSQALERAGFNVCMEYLTGLFPEKVSRFIIPRYFSSPSQYIPSCHKAVS